MPQHQSAVKRVRQTERRRVRNRNHVSRLRTMIKKLSNTSEREQATPLLNATKSFIDKLAGKGIVKANKAANTKSRLERMVNGL